MNSNQKVTPTVEEAQAAEIKKLKTYLAVLLSVVDDNKVKLDPYFSYDVRALVREED